MLRASLLALVLLLACSSFLSVHAVKSRARSHRRWHVQGETLADPEHFLAGVDPTRFRFPQSASGPAFEGLRSSGAPGSFEVGAGIYDVTGQVAEIGFMGYAVPDQKGAGIHMRTRSRAFVFVDVASGKRVVYVSIDLGMGFQMMKQEVIERLKAKFGPDMYTHANVLISGTHTHAAPGGLGGTVLVDITTLGFIPENFEAGAEGIFQSIVMAHNNVQPATIKINVGQCDGCNINRSPSAYLLDPERSQYANDTDHAMTLLRIENSRTGEEIGMINWFAVHGTSLNNTNMLVSGDNKGYASLRFEERKNPPGTEPGKGAFVAAFGQSSLGDVSPNTNGPRCPDGSPCDFAHSTCGGLTQGCIATGPGLDQYDSMRIIGQKQVDAAWALYESASVELSGAGVDYRHQYVDMQGFNVSSAFTSTGKAATTCNAALGYSFAAGTTDGPGMFDFTQGTTSPNPFWAAVSELLVKPTQADLECQAPKPILLAVGNIKPISWVPYILPEQVFRIGNLWILSVPGEFSTMAGRRLRNMVQAILANAGQWRSDSHVVIAGLSNSYSHYITTYEEYQAQRYEGASTLYGPHTLAAHMQSFAGLVDSIITNRTVAPGPEPIDMRNKTFSFMPPVVMDNPPLGKSFGSVETDVRPSYKRGEMVSVAFWGASPRNNLQTQSSFLFVQRQQSGTWVTVAVDGNYETKFKWTRVGLDQSLCTCEWDVTDIAVPGTYRIMHKGVSKALGDILTPYEGFSSTFVVTA